MFDKCGNRWYICFTIMKGWLIKMEKRIRKSSHGGYVVEFGNLVKEQPNPCGVGYIMSGFIVCKSVRCGTYKEAEKVKFDA